MGSEFSTMEHITDSMQEPIRLYTEQVRGFAGNNALSLTLFGAIAAGTFDRVRHTVRNVLVLESVDLEMLRRLSQEGVKLGKARISAPLIMTPGYILASLDTFPLELIEIQQCHLTLFGADQFEALSFDDKHVRLQCEREIKTVLIGMRQGLLAAAGREKSLAPIEIDVAERMTRTFRGLLWLKGRKEASPSSNVLSDLETLLGKELPGVRASLAAGAQHGWGEFQALYHDVEAVGRFVDEQ